MGTGDGTFAYRMAKAQPETLVIGIDSNCENLSEISRKALQKPAKGGLENILFGQLALEQAPGELIGIADSLSVILPWGTLLKAVALPDSLYLKNLAALCKPKAVITILFGYGSADQKMVATLDAGFAVKTKTVPLKTIQELPSRWAKKLAFSGKERVFVKVEGHSRIDSIQHMSS
jgi:hypothetical protein